MKKSLFSLTALLLVLSMVLAACSGNKDTGSKGENNKGEGPQDGGVLTYAMEAEFKGLLDINFYDSSSDAEILSFTTDGLITFDENLKPIPNIAEWKTNDNKVYHFTFKKGVKWHNGDELVVDDWIFAIETIAKIGPKHKRWPNVSTIEGVKEFNEGKASTISGLKKINDYEIEVTFDKARVNNLENLWTYPMNRRHFQGLKIDKEVLEGSDQVRLNPVGTGPFKVTKVVPGESVELTRFDDYWKGKPHIEKIIIKVIDGSLIVKSLEKGEIDMSAFHPSLLPEVEKLAQKNLVKIEKVPGLSYYYIGFKLGTFKDGKVVMNKDKYANKKLRQAMLYAIDREKWINSWFYGLGNPVNRPVPTAHWIAADNSELPNNYTYDPEKAKQLLDEAGYKDINGDGFREDPNGKEFVVKFSHYDTGNPTYADRAKAITQYWEQVGLKTELKMTEVNLYYDQLEKDHESMEVFYGGWGTGADPDPWPLWGDDAVWNYPRWVNEEANNLLKQAVDYSVVGQDTEKRKQLYVEWQKIFNEEVPALPIMELQDAWALTSRVQDVKIDSTGIRDVHKWWIKQK